MKHKQRRLQNDLTGQYFGDLQVLRRVDNAPGKNRAGAVMFECKCLCGKIVNVRSGSLTSHRTKSCGCRKAKHCKELSKKNRKEPGYSGLIQLMFVYKRSAQRKNHEFSLSVEDFRRLTSSNCYYCGVKPYRKRSNGRTKHSTYIYNGIDRVDNSIGYTLSNCVPCCFVCNDWKSNMTQNEFLAHVKRIADIHKYEH